MPSFIKRLLLLAIASNILISMLGCGKPSQAAASTGNTQGVFVDAQTVALFQTQFDETVACTQLTKGKFSDLSVIVMPPSFSCPYYASGCSGEFQEPNLIKIGLFSSWKHEMVHYLLYVNTGDPDTNHKSPLFQTCGSIVSG